MEPWSFCRPVVADFHNSDEWSRFRICIKVKSWIQIRIEVMQIRNPDPNKLTQKLSLLKQEKNVPLLGSRDTGCPTNRTSLTLSQCCGSGSGTRSGAFFTLDPGSGIGFFPDPGSRISDRESQSHIFDSFNDKLFGKKYNNS
jgi:hypothetical protein